MERMIQFLTYFKSMLPQILEGLSITMEIFIFTLLLSIPLGIAVAMCRLSKCKPLSKITEFYILVMRGTPLLLQIVFIYFGLPLVMNLKFDRMIATVIAFVLNYAAYFAEIFRAGISSIDKGQYEGAEVLGLSKKDTFFRIILPQATKRVLPPIGNEITTLVKDTSLASVVGLDEMLRIGKIATNRDGSLLPLLMIAIVYLIVIYLVSHIMAYIEKKYNYYS